MTDRQPCAVPGCRCSRRDDGTFAEWICRKHWLRVAPELRRAFNADKARIRRLLRRKPGLSTWWHYPAGSSNRLAGVAMWRRNRTLWARVKAAAAEEP